MVIETDKLPEVISFYKTWNSGPEQLWSLCVCIWLGFLKCKIKGCNFPRRPTNNFDSFILISYKYPFLLPQPYPISTPLSIIFSKQIRHACLQ